MSWLAVHEPIRGIKDLYGPQLKRFQSMVALVKSCELVPPAEYPESIREWFFMRMIQLELFIWFNGCIDLLDWIELPTPVEYKQDVTTIKCTAMDERYSSNITLERDRWHTSCYCRSSRDHNIDYNPSAILYRWMKYVPQDRAILLTSGWSEYEKDERKRDKILYEDVYRQIKDIYRLCHPGCDLKIGDRNADFGYQTRDSPPF